MTYFKTTNLTPGQLAQREQAASSQTHAVKIFFNLHPTGKFTASEVHKILIDEEKISHWVPLTSIRRAISSLQKIGWVNMMEETKSGVYGWPEHYYQLSTGWGRAGYSEEHPINLL